jgi:hypothetical protein
LQMQQDANKVSITSPTPPNVDSRHARRPNADTQQDDGSWKILKTDSFL